MLIVMGALMLLIIILQWLMPNLVDHTVPFGVRIPPDHLQDQAVSQAHRRYAFGLAITFVICTATWLWSWLANPNGAALATIISLFPLLPLVLGFANYYAVHQKLHREKVEGRWMEGHRQVVTVETDTTLFRETASWAWAIPTLLVIIATFLIGGMRYPQIPHMFPIHFDANGVATHYATKSVMSVFILPFVQIGTLLMMAVLHVVTQRVRGSLDPTDPVGSARRQAHRTAHLIRAIWLLMACINVGMLWTNLVIWGEIHVNPTGVMLGTLIPTFAGLTVVIMAVARSPISTLSGNGRAQSADDGDITVPRTEVGRPSATRASSGTIQPVRRDDDVNWYMGAFYFNRDDSRFLVEKRFGVGWTVNFAHPLSWVILSIIILVVVGSWLLRP